LVAARYTEIKAGSGRSGQFDAKHLKAIHHHLFQDVYEWAGRTRDERVALSDGAIATEPLLSKVDRQPFLTGPAIPAALDDIATRLRDADYLRGLPREAFAERAADVMVELNAAHPFRSMRGRSPFTRFARARSDLSCPGRGKKQPQGRQSYSNSSENAPITVRRVRWLGRARCRRATARRAEPPRNRLPPPAHRQASCDIAADAPRSPRSS
jgi:hypothetical protein